DLKPANIMVGSFGEVLVMDWGLARDLGESPSEDAVLRSAARPAAAPPVPAEPSALEETASGSRLTRADSLLGTLGYMAPEQARNEEVGPQADVFSLGAMLAEVLTGAPPIAGETNLDLLTATLDGRIVLPR